MIDYAGTGEYPIVNQAPLPFVAIHLSLSVEQGINSDEDKIKSNLHPIFRQWTEFVIVKKMQSHTFFHREGPKYRSSCAVPGGLRDFTQLYRMCLTKQSYGLCWISSLSVLLMCMHTSEHHIWSNSGL